MSSQVQFLKDLKFNNGSSSLNHPYGSILSSFSLQPVLKKGFAYTFALKVIDHNRNWGSFVEVAMTVTPDKDAAPWNLIQWPKNGLKSYKTEKPGIGFMNWSGGKSHIVTTGEIMDIIIDLEFDRPTVTFIKRNTDQSTTCPLDDKANDFYINFSIWSQGGLMFVDPVIDSFLKDRTILKLQHKVNKLEAVLVSTKERVDKLQELVGKLLEQKNKQVSNSLVDNNQKV